MEKNQNDNWIFIAALVLSIVMFVFGMLLGNYIANSKLSEFRQTEEHFIIDLVSFETKESVLNENVCKLDMSELFEEKITLGKMMTELEKRMGKENEDVIAKKEIYELIEIKTLQYMERIKTECGDDFNIVLLFYTNRKGDTLGSVDGCEDQGKILDQIVYDREHSEGANKVYVFVFDANSRNMATEALIEKYGITSVPSLVINGKAYGYMIKEDIESLLE